MKRTDLADYFFDMDRQRGTDEAAIKPHTGELTIGQFVDLEDFGPMTGRWAVIDESPSGEYRLERIGS